MTFWEWFGIYVGAAVMFGLLGGMFQSGSWKERQVGARIIFLSPVWPLILVYGIFIGVRELWDRADFGSDL